QASIKASATDPHAAKVEAAVKKLKAEFDAGNTMPSAEARRQIRELAALGRSGQAMLPVVEAWLKRMHDRGQFSSAEFTELAQAMLTLEPEVPGRTAAAYVRERSYDLKLYPTNKLLAFGKAALPAVADALKTE